MAARLKIYDIARLEGRTVFFDANILIYLFWPTGNNRCEDDYAKFFSACLKRSIPLAIDFLVVSEATNMMLRLEYRKACATRGQATSAWSFKSFRDSNDGQRVQSEVFALLKKRLVGFSVVGKAFTAHEIAGFLSVDRLDFVDKAIASLCLENNLVLATHDADFAEADVDIISTNPAYFAAAGS